MFVYQELITVNWGRREPIQAPSRGRWRRRPRSTGNRRSLSSRDLDFTESARLLLAEKDLSEAARGDILKHDVAVVVVRGVKVTARSFKNARPVYQPR